MVKKKKSIRTGKGVSKGKKPSSNAFRQQGRVFFVTYKGTLDSGKKLTKQELRDQLMRVKCPDPQIQHIDCRENTQRSPKHYIICQQTYADGQPHLHAILIYQYRLNIRNPHYFDVLGIHPHFEPMRNMQAALQYVQKQDPVVLTDLNLQVQIRKAKMKDSRTIFQHLYQQMKKDPFNFHAYTYIQKHRTAEQVYRTGYMKAIHLLKHVQKAHCNQLLHTKPGFKLITKALIRSRLTPSELKTYNSWSGYQKIVNHLNTMTTLRGRRPQKTMNLLITGAPNSGKSALVWQRNPEPGRMSLLQHCSVYPMGMKGWFPDYESDTYHCIYWNQAKLTSYPYDVILELLDGNPVTLPAKGGGHKKIDNPLVIATSNMTLDQLIKAKFHYDKDYLQMAKENLAVRIQNVIIPKGKTLFLLQKLLVPVTEDYFQPSYAITDTDELLWKQGM